jgi:hypothetical protein
MRNGGYTTRGITKATLNYLVLKLLTTMLPTPTSSPPWSMVMVCGQPKQDIQLVRRARATVSAVMSGIGISG